MRNFKELNVNQNMMIKKYCDFFRDYTNFKDDLIEYICNKSYQRKFDEKLKEKIFNAYKFSSYDNNKFILLS